MKIRQSNAICITSFFLFIIFTFLVENFDLKPIGIQNSMVGMATINQFFKEILGQSELWYNITTITGIITLFIVLGFFIFGVIQFIKRKKIAKVDFDIILFDVYIIFLILIYWIFETYLINYRPIMLEKVLEPSYPSSHTFFVSSIMGVVIIIFNNRIKNGVFKNIIKIFSFLIIILTVFGRFMSGVHWFTDILGGVILSILLIFLYNSIYLKMYTKK